jgi:subtilase family serine protease
VHGTAPGANILFAGAQNCFTPGLNDALRAIVDGHLADVITNSYGDNGGDLLDSSSDRASTDDILLMADGTGISVMFSSGDNGDEFTTVGTVAPDYPASSPYATAIGGTTLQIGSDGSRTGEFGWSTARSFLCDATWAALGGCATSQEGTWLPIDLALDGGSGGGTSYVYPQPNYQAGVVSTSLSEANGSSIPMRVEPDISMDADPATGMLEGETQTFPNGTYYDTYRIGGTSVASPLFAGLVARADEAAGGSLGFLNPALYSLSGNSGALYDVGPAGSQDMSRADYVNSVDSSAGFYHTTRIIDYEGPEQFCGSLTGRSKQHMGCVTRNVALNTATGYDNMTGLGSPGTGLVADLAATK